MVLIKDHSAQAISFNRIVQINKKKKITFWRRLLIRPGGPFTLLLFAIRDNTLQNNICTLFTTTTTTTTSTTTSSIHTLVKTLQATAHSGDSEGLPGRKWKAIICSRFNRGRWFYSALHLDQWEEPGMKNQGIELHPPHQSAPTNYTHYSPNTKQTHQSSVGPLNEKLN